MSCKISFYHLTTTGLERALPQLLGKIVASDKRAVVLAGSPERVNMLDSQLWTFDPNSFLPHGCEKTGHANQQPIWLTHAQENPNEATFLILLDNRTSGLMDTMERTLVMFDARDQEAVQHAREQWKHLKEQEYELEYYKQDERGKWEKSG